MILNQITQKNASKKIVLIVIDRLGGLAQNGKTELEAANIPHLDQLAKNSVCGLAHPLSPGITPGSGPAHLALFGYDPFKYQIKRGLLSAFGIGVSLSSQEIAARANFATLDEQGKIKDRRAGRLSTEECKRLCQKLDKIKISEVLFRVFPEREHRACVILRGEGLSDQIEDTDPQKTGVFPLQTSPTPDAFSWKALYTAKIVNEFIKEVFHRLKTEKKANALLLRGFQKKISLPNFNSKYSVSPCAIAVYPMYKGLARLIGFEVIESKDSLEDEIQALKEVYHKYDFFYLHYKGPDTAGEDGDFERKIACLERFDKLVPEILALKPACLCITGDHCTPSAIRSHSFHPVPVLIHSSCARIDKVSKFTEEAFLKGGLGVFSQLELMPLLLAHAERLLKYGA
jgi:2,3-bisphosphoglycerate-independent phosphoglycerate mutase